jgi:hypothetical protein
VIVLEIKNGFAGTQPGTIKLMLFKGPAPVIFKVLDVISQVLVCFSSLCCGLVNSDGSAPVVRKGVSVSRLRETRQRAFRKPRAVIDSLLVFLRGY